MSAGVGSIDMHNLSSSIYIGLLEPRKLFPNPREQVSGASLRARAMD